METSLVIRSVIFTSGDDTEAKQLVIELINSGARTRLVFDVSQH
jgi:predicted dinucleotide-binding enzyme